MAVKRVVLDLRSFRKVVVLVAVIGLLSAGCLLLLGLSTRFVTGLDAGTYAERLQSFVNLASVVLLVLSTAAYARGALEQDLDEKAKAKDAGDTALLAFCLAVVSAAMIAGAFSISGSLVRILLYGGLLALGAALGLAVLALAAFTAIAAGNLRRPSETRVVAAAPPPDQWSASLPLIGAAPPPSLPTDAVPQGWGSKARPSAGEGGASEGPSPTPRDA